MRIIEPCCAQRDIRRLRDDIGKNGTAEFGGFGDLSLSELLPAVLTRYAGAELLIAAPSLPDQAAEAVTMCMRRTRAKAYGPGNIYVVEHLTVIADLGEEKSPVASGWVRDNPFGDRLTLVDKEQEDTVILLPDFAITGPVNLRYGHEFTATATTVKEDVSALWEKYAPSAAKEEEEPEQAEEPAAAATEPAKEDVPEKEESPKKEKPGLEAGLQEGEQDADQAIV